MMKPQKKTSIERSQESLFSKLKKLKEYNIIKHSLNPEDAASDFEILEFYGDSVLYERIAFFLLKTRRFMCPDLLTKIRQECINNKNLALCFDILNLRDLTTYSITDRILVTKQKADVVEAIIGELAEAIDRADSLTRDAEAKSVLEELLAFISYNGEKEFFALGSPAALSSSPPQKNPSPPTKSPSPPHQKPHTKSSSPPHQKISPPPNSHPQPIMKTFKASNKQNMYKNNISPHKASKKANLQADEPPTPIPVIPPPPLLIPQYTLLSHQPPLKPMQHELPSPRTPPPALVIPTTPTSTSIGLLTPQSLTASSPSHPLPSPRQPLSSPNPSLPSPNPSLSSPTPPPSSYAPSTEIFLGGRNVAVYSAS